MLALLPLDDRPCNHLFPARLAALGGSQLLQPPRELLGCFNVPAQFDTLEPWLRELPDEVDALIVSIDMLAYGGLVASRRTDVSLPEALARLDSLSAWREQRPNVPIYAFNVLMRLAVTMDSDEAISHYYNVMRWARLADEAPRFASPYLTEQLQNVEREIPPQLLANYKAARARNHAVNKMMVDALAGSVVDFLLITQEDCTEYGLHRQEQAALLEKVERLGVADRFALHPGADEAALTLLARHWNTGVKFRLRPSSHAGMERIPGFEDVPYAASLASHVAAMGGELLPYEENAEGAGRADFELFVNAPEGNSQREEKPEARAARLAALGQWVGKIGEATKAHEAGGPMVALCDVAFPNGADEILLRQLERRNLLGHLDAFAAWNTAGNTTGTLLCQCAALHRARAGGHAASAANREWVFERLLDDWCYQTHIRARMDQLAREKGISPLNMGAESGGIEAQTRLELSGYGHMIAARQFETRLEKIEVALPWHRTFEVEVRARLAPPTEG